MVPPSRPPADRPDDAEARAERRARSIEEPLDVRSKAREPYPILEVRNPIHRTAYLVLLPEFPSSAPALCTCTDYARRGLGTCKHIEAGIRWLRSHPETGRADAPPPPPKRSGLWAEIERRLGDLPAPERLTGRVLARAGAALYE